jgi:hypothetical protein
LGHLFLQPILQEMAHLRAQSALARELLLDTKIASLPDGYVAGVWGAIHLARQAVGEPPI